MDATTVMLDPIRLVLAAVIGLILLLVLIIKFKVHAMISILVGAIAIGLIAGMPLTSIVDSVNEGIGNTLKGIALLVGLGSMFGAILEVSGGAQTLAITMVRRFGDEKAAWALGITGLIVPRLNGAAILIRLLALLCTAILGLYGFVLFMIVVLIHLLSIQSYSYPYIALSTQPQAVKDIYIRAPLNKMKTRPMFAKDRYRR